MSVAEREFDPEARRKGTDMKNLTYEMYLANPALREQLEREARRARSEAIYAFFWALPARMARQIFTRAEPRAVRPIHAA